MIAAGAALVAWVGASLVVLADRRRGLALGIALAVAGLSTIVLLGAGPLEAGALLVGGAIASARRLGSGPEGWGIMPAGSTPRFVLCVAVGLLAVWFALAVTTGGDSALRFVALVVVALAAARVLSGGEPDIVLSAAALLALALAAAAGLAQTAPGPWPYLAAALVAAAVCSIPIEAAANGV